MAFVRSVWQAMYKTEKQASAEDEVLPQWLDVQGAFSAFPATPVSRPAELANNPPEDLDEAAPEAPTPSPAKYKRKWSSRACDAYIKGNRQALKEAAKAVTPTASGAELNALMNKIGLAKWQELPSVEGEIYFDRAGMGLTGGH